MSRKRARSPAAADSAQQQQQQETTESGVPSKRPRIDKEPRKQDAGTKESLTKAIKIGTKRPRLAGTVRKLTAQPTASSAQRPSALSKTAKVTLSGNKINKGLGTGGFRASVKGKDEEEVMMITRKSPFSFLLKKGIAAFVERSVKHLTVKAIGAAIPLALILALAIQDNLPCPKESVSLDVRTSSIDCLDEVIPPDELAETVDIQYQTRIKSAIAVRLSVPG